jgi:hypothetical protein
MKRLLLFGMVLILSACGSARVSTPAPTPQAINVIYPSALQPWADAITRCSSGDPQVAVYFLQSGIVDTNIGPNDIILEFGDPGISSEGIYLSQVGLEQVVVVVNSENPLSQLSNHELKSIFSGQATNFDSSLSQPFQVWVLPVDEPTRLIFDLAVMKNQLTSTEVMLAPDPGAMLEAVSQNSNAIGYLPGSFITAGEPSFTSKLKIIQLESSMEDLLHQPVVAITQAEPEGLLRSLLVCLEVKSP